MKENVKFYIAFAAYNGERYLADQLDSILSRTWSDWELIISDDSSTDTTTEIIRKYYLKDSRIF